MFSLIHGFHSSYKPNGDYSSVPSDDAADSDSLPSFFQFAFRNICVWIAQDIAVFPLSLGPVHRAVGIPNEIFCPSMQVRTHRDPNAGSHHDGFSNLNWRTNFREDEVGDPTNISGTAHIVQQDHKFIAAIPSDDISLSHTPLQELCGLA